MKYILLFIFPIISGFSQSISGKLKYIDNGQAATANVYLNGTPDKSITERIRKDGTFIISDLKNISSIEIVNIQGAIHIVGFEPEKEYELGNLYFIDNPHNQLHHFAYKTKIGHFLGWLTEGSRSRRLTKKAIKENHQLLADKYKSEGKNADFLQKYNGNTQILNLETLKN